MPDSQPSISSLDNQVLSPGSGQAPRDSDDLYTWMAKHQDFVEATNDKVEPGFVNKGAFWVQYFMCVLKPIIYDEKLMKSRF